MHEAIDPSLSPIQTSEIEIYSLKDSFAIFFHHPPHYLTWPFETVLQVVVWVLWYASLLITDLQDGKWIREEKMSASLRDTDEPSTWCFVLSSFCNASVQIDVIVYNFLMYFCCRLWAFRTDCYGFTIPSTWVCVSAFSATCCSLTVMEFRGHRNKFWLSWGSVCCSVGWGCRNPMRARMWACM